MSAPTGAKGVRRSSEISTESVAALLGQARKETIKGAINIAINRVFICFTS